MELLLNEIQKLSRLDINKILYQVFSDKGLQKDIITTIQQKQLFQEGVSEENIIIGYYSPYTEQINPSKKAYTHYTLYDTGAFYDSFKIYVNADSFVIDADGDKGDKNLFEVYNKAGNLLGLTPENMEWLIETIIPKINERIRAML